MRIREKTDRHRLPMWFLWSRRIVIFLSQACRGVLLFVRDDRRFSARANCVSDFNAPSVFVLNF